MSVPYAMGLPHLMVWILPEFIDVPDIQFHSIEIYDYYEKSKSMQFPYYGP